MMSSMRDVIVVGGGPAGLHAAARLAEQGFDVAVLEEHQAIGLPAHCTGIVSDEVFGLVKVPETLILGQPRLCRVVAPSGRVFPMSAPGEQITVIDRQRFDQTLEADARQAGAEIMTGARVERVTLGPDRVEVGTARGMALSGRACVLACGVGYGLQRQLGLGLPPQLLHGAQIELDADGPSDAVELHLADEVAPHGFGWLVPLSRDGRPRVKAGLMMWGDAVATLGRFVRRQGLGERLNGHLAHAVRRLLPLAPLARTYGHRLVLVGDAAGLTKPTTGGGIFYSLLSATLAAETLGEALTRDRLAAVDLASYEARWRARLGPHLRISSYVRRLVAKLTATERERLLEAVAREDIQAVLRETAQFNWHGEFLRAVLRVRAVSAVLLHALLR